MKYDDIGMCPSEAVENDWLDVTFTQAQKPDENAMAALGRESKIQRKNPFAKVKILFARKKEEKAQSKNSENALPFEVKKTGRAKSVFKRVWKPVAACAVIALVLVGMRFVDTGFVGDVFNYAQTTFTSNINGESQNENIMTLPSNATVTVENGNITLSGGTLALNLQNGKVKDVSETSVTVSVSDNFDIVYSNLSEVLVNAGDEISKYHVVGKYGENAVINFIVDGNKVIDVTADGYTVTWNE